jgi:hypothetical protein
LKAELEEPGARSPGFFFVVFAQGTKEEKQKGAKLPRSLAPKIVGNEAGSLVSIFLALMTISPGDRPNCSLKSTAA